MDDIDRAEIIAAGYDPDDPTTLEAIDLVRWDLAMLHPDDLEAN